MRILQLNVWARSGPYETRTRLLRHEVGLLAPDLIALQEVDTGPGESNQAEELFGPLGYDVVFERRDGDYRGDPGIAVATRHPVRDRILPRDVGHLGTERDLVRPGLRRGHGRRRSGGQVTG